LSNAIKGNGNSLKKNKIQNLNESNESNFNKENKITKNY
jgi:hypothetical protein